MKTILIKYNFDGRMKRKRCIINESGDGQYTMCGNAYTDSTLEMENFEAVNRMENTSDKMPTCTKCIKTLDYYKSLKYPR